jgi:hypothetical protein
MLGRSLNGPSASPWISHSRYDPAVSSAVGQMGDANARTWALGRGIDRLVTAQRSRSHGASSAPEENRAAIGAGGRVRHMRRSQARPTLRTRIRSQLALALPARPRPFLRRRRSAAQPQRPRWMGNGRRRRLKPARLRACETPRCRLLLCRLRLGSVSPRTLRTLRRRLLLPRRLRLPPRPRRSATRRPTTRAPQLSLTAPVRLRRPADRTRMRSTLEVAIPRRRSSRRRRLRPAPQTVA